MLFILGLQLLERAIDNVNLKRLDGHNANCSRRCYICLGCYLVQGRGNQGTESTCLLRAIY